MTSLAGPPVRPRFVISELTGYSTTFGAGGRKPRTTWTVLDRLSQGFPVGIDHYIRANAEAELDDHEAAWEHWLATGVWVTPHAEERRRELRYQRGGKRYRAWCGVCKRKSRAGTRVCDTCGRSLY